jgi:predicted component of type VI protein secretion system
VRQTLWRSPPTETPTPTTAHTIDLFSTNGTWVNEVSLMPQHPFPLKSGSQIRLGKLRIFIVFHEEAFKDGKQDQASHDQINEPD